MNGVGSAKKQSSNARSGNQFVVKDEFGSIVTQESGLAEVKCPTGKYFCSWNLPALKDYESEFIDYNGSHPTYGPFSSLIDESKYKPWLEGQSIDSIAPLRGYYYQCLGNLFIGKADWIDFVVFFHNKDAWATRQGDSDSIGVERLSNNDKYSSFWNERLLPALSRSFMNNNVMFEQAQLQFIEKYGQIDEISQVDQIAKNLERGDTRHSTVEQRKERVDAQRRKDVDIKVLNKMTNEAPHIIDELSVSDEIKEALKTNDFDDWNEVVEVSKIDEEGLDRLKDLTEEFQKRPRSKKRRS